LPVNPSPARYVPARQRSETADYHLEPGYGAPPAGSAVQSPEHQEPRIVLSAPSVAPVHISTPPLSAEVATHEGTADAHDSEPVDVAPIPPPGREHSSEGPEGSLSSASGSIVTQSEHPSNPLPVAPVPSRPVIQPASTSSKPRAGMAKPKTVASPLVKASPSASTLFGVQLDAEPNIEKPAKRRYRSAAAIAVVVLSGSAGGYWLVRRNHLKNNVSAQALEVQPDAVAAVETPTVEAPVEISVTPTESPAEKDDRLAETASNQLKK